VKFQLGLEHLAFGGDFNQSINNITFPVSLKRLIFGTSFNQNIDNVKFPSSLQELTFSNEFNQTIDNIKFLSSLRQLTLPYRYICLHTFPLSLLVLIIGSTRYKRRNLNVVLNLQYLTLADFYA
jgi:hypothetical protein